MVLNDFLFTPCSYSIFLSANKLPIGLASLSLPFVGIYGQLHKSKQTAWQLLSQKQAELWDRVIKEIDSTDSVLVQLFRVINHATLLNKWVVKYPDDMDYLVNKLEFVINEWSAIYAENRFFPAVLRLQNILEPIDAAICGYEKLLKIVISKKEVSFDNRDLSILIRDLAKLEEEVKLFRNELEVDYQAKASSLANQYGFY